MNGSNFDAARLNSGPWRSVEIAGPVDIVADWR